MPNTDLIAFDGGFLVCDMLLDASATHELQLTEFAIETGAVISDHAIFRPQTINLTLLQTETPIEVIDGFAVTTRELAVPGRVHGRQTTTLDVRQSQRPVVTANQLIGAVTSRLSGAIAGAIKVDGLKVDTRVGTSSVKVTALTTDSPKARINEFYEQLLSLFEGVTPLVITVKGRVWTDMILTSVTRTDAPGQFGAARFNVALQRVSTVTTQTVELPPVPEATRTKARGAKPAEAPKPEQRISILEKSRRAGVDLIDSFTGP